MFEMICPFPCEASVPSLRTMIVGVCPPKDMFKYCGSELEEFGERGFQG